MVGQNAITSQNEMSVMIFGENVFAPYNSGKSPEADVTGIANYIITFKSSIFTEMQSP